LILSKISRLNNNLILLIELSRLAKEEVFDEQAA
jgi:hypothetical protein